MYICKNFSETSFNYLHRLVFEQRYLFASMKIFHYNFYQKVALNRFDLYTLFWFWKIFEEQCSRYPLLSSLRTILVRSRMHIKPIGLKRAQERVSHKRNKWLHIKPYFYYGIGRDSHVYWALYFLCRNQI